MSRAAAIFVCVLLACLPSLGQFRGVLSISTYVDVPLYWNSGPVMAIDNAGNACGGAAGTWVKIKPDGSPAWSVQYGNGSYTDVVASAAAIDSQGNCYIAGFGQVIPTTGAFQSRVIGQFILKFDPAGNLVYATYLDGSSSSPPDRAQAMAADSNGNVWIVGRTGSNDFPLLNPIQSALGGGSSGFVAKLNSSGSGLLFSSYLTGENGAELNALTVDDAGNAYITGVTSSATFPTTSGSLQPVYAGGAGGNAFLTKLTPNGAIVYSTFIGDTTTIRGKAIVTDSPGNAYMLGEVGAGIAIVKLNPSGSALAFSKTFGTNVSARGIPAGGGIAVDSSGNVFVAGTAGDFYSSYFPPQLPLLAPIQPQFNGGNSDAFVLQVDSTGTLLFSTYLGGPGSDSGGPIGVDNQGNVFAVPYTSNLPFPLVNAYDGAFIALNPLACSKYFEVCGPRPMLVKLTPGSGTVLSRPDAVDFTKSGSVPAVGTSRGPAPVFLANMGTTSITISNVTVSGDYSLTKPAVPATLAAGATFSMNVTLTPTASGPRPGDIVITDDAPGSPHTIHLIGAGLALVPAAAVSPASLTFAGQEVNTSSIGKAVSVQNTGNADLTITRVSVSGDFAETNNCAPAIAPGSSCAFLVTFKPSAIGARTGSLTITDNAPDSPQVIPLTGTGTSTESMSPSSLSFGNQMIGTVSSAQTVTLSNSGGALLNLTGITISSEFAQTNTCGSSLMPGASCSFTVTFSPTSAGSKSGSLSVTSSAPSSPHIVALTGAGMSLGLSPVAATTATVAAGQIATYNMSLGGAGWSGTVALACSGAPTGATCTVPATMTVTAGSTTPFTVTVSTTARSTAMLSPRSWRLMRAFAFILPGLLLLPGTVLRRRKMGTGLILTLLILLLSLIACGGGGGGGGTPAPSPNPSGTPGGTYPLTLTATAGGTAQTASLTLTVN